MNRKSSRQDPLVLSYLDLRKAVGIIGVALPFVLALGGWGIQDSISNYYYTDMRNVLVGSLCAIGVFLFSTRGYDVRDKIAGILASVFAVGVAFLPTTPEVDATRHERVVGKLHLTCAALLFLTFAYFCLMLFTETDPTKTPTHQKLQRNTVFRVCGWAILAFIALIVVGKLPQVELRVASLRPVFWLEALAVEAFGVAWLTKGEAILKDQ